MFKKEGGMQISMLEFALLGAGAIVATDGLVYLFMRWYRSRHQSSALRIAKDGI